MSQLTMYPGQVNSPATELAGPIDDTQTTISVVDASILPDAPNIATISVGENAETVLYTNKDNITNELTGVTRGFQGGARAWNAGIKIRRLFTAYDWDSIRENHESHLAESVTDVGGAHGVEYEEGEFTPILEFDGMATDIIYTRNVGRYIRTNNVVSIELEISLSSKGNSTGNATIKGLPFAPNSNRPYRDILLSVGLYLIFPATAKAITGTILSSDRIYLNTIIDNLGNGALTHSNFNNNTTIRFTGSYQI